MPDLERNMIPDYEYDPDSILDSTKKALGIRHDYSHFDPEIIMYINSAFSRLWTLGVGPDQPYAISSRDNLWNEFLESKKQLDMIQTYIYAKVKLVFDPPSNSFVVESLKKIIDEIEWVSNAIAESDSL